MPKVTDYMPGEFLFTPGVDPRNEATVVCLVSFQGLMPKPDADGNDCWVQPCYIHVVGGKSQVIGFPRVRPHVHRELFKHMQDVYPGLQVPLYHP